MPRLPKAENSQKESPPRRRHPLKTYYAVDHGSSTQPTISEMTVGGEVAATALGAVADKVIDRAVVTLQDLDEHVSNPIESTLEYLDGLLNADLDAETQASDPRQESVARASGQGSEQVPPPDYRPFAPLYGGVEFDTLPSPSYLGRVKKIFQTLTFSKAALGQSDLDGGGDVDDDDRALSEFEVSGGPDHGYEHDLKILDPDFEGSSVMPFCQNVRERFWARRGAVYWESNLDADARPYLDNPARDGCNVQDFSIGLQFPLNLSGGKKYWIRMHAQSGLKTMSPYQLNAQKTRRFVGCPATVGGGFCSADAGTGPESRQTFVGPTKGRTEECRRWRNGRYSRRTCDHLGE